ncbi:zonadhesin-like [Leptopilina heterotoma]|uniref:zonadhesin-like n=1 Tax=Leptopilina heterotoma TaxID=63436 RepID=UPI001CA9E61F|nr:zonadhesin-like [Leptopilina heterotoma]
MSPITITFFIVLVVSASTVNAQPRPPQRCGRFASYSNCASRCPASCEGLKNPNPMMCAADCVYGCRCYPGYIRISGTNPDCMLESDCPHLNTGTTRRPVEPIRDCGPNAVWVKCATVCPETCETIKNPQPVFCTKQCYRGCVCQEGFVKRTKESVECILPEQC